MSEDDRSVVGGEEVERGLGVAAELGAERLERTPFAEARGLGAELAALTRRADGVPDRDGLALDAASLLLARLRHDGHRLLQVEQLDAGREFAEVLGDHEGVQVDAGHPLGLVVGVGRLTRLVVGDDEAPVGAALEAVDDAAHGRVPDGGLEFEFEADRLDPGGVLGGPVTNRQLLRDEGVVHPGEAPTCVLREQRAIDVLRGGQAPQIQSLWPHRYLLHSPSNPK